MHMAPPSFQKSVHTDYNNGMLSEGFNIEQHFTLIFSTHFYTRQEETDDLETTPKSVFFSSHLTKGPVNDNGPDRLELYNWPSILVKNVLQIFMSGFPNTSYILTSSAADPCVLIYLVWSLRTVTSDSRRISYNSQ